jgi:hypothetical protein
VPVKPLAAVPNGAKPTPNAMAGIVKRQGAPSFVRTGVNDAMFAADPLHGKRDSSNCVQDPETGEYTCASGSSSLPSPASNGEAQATLTSRAIMPAPIRTSSASRVPSAATTVRAVTSLRIASSPLTVKLTVGDVKSEDLGPVYQLPKINTQESNAFPTVEQLEKRAFWECASLTVSWSRSPI